MKIRIEYGYKDVVCDTVQEAGLHLMEHFREEVSQTMGKMTLERLREYAQELPLVIKRVDHSIKWKNV